MLPLLIGEHFILFRPGNLGPRWSPSFPRPCKPQEKRWPGGQHSQSETVRGSLLQQEDRLRLEIRDWGVGFDTRAVQGNRFGLEGIRQRAKLLGGKCGIRSTAGKGTRITVELPVVLRD